MAVSLLTPVMCSAVRIGQDPKSLLVTRDELAVPQADGEDGPSGHTGSACWPSVVPGTEGAGGSEGR